MTQITWDEYYVSVLINERAKGRTLNRMQLEWIQRFFDRHHPTDSELGKQLAGHFSREAIRWSLDHPQPHFHHSHYTPKGISNTMYFQQKVLAHLAVERHPQRILCLKDLIDKGALYPSSEKFSKNIVETYLQANPRGFCKEGIERFRNAIGLPADNKKKIRIVLDVEVDLSGPLHFAQNSPREDGGIVHGILNAIRNKELSLNSGHPVGRVTRADWMDYNTDQAVVDFKDGYGKMVGSKRSFQPDQRG